MAESYSVTKNLGATLRVKKIHCEYLVDTATGHLGNTGFTLPDDAVVLGGLIDVTTADATETINIGVSGSLTAIASGISVGTATQVGFDETFPQFNLGGKEILISSATGTQDTGKFDAYIEYLAQ